MDGCRGAGEGFILLISRSARFSRLKFLIARTTAAPMSSQHDVLRFTPHVGKPGERDLQDAPSMRRCAGDPVARRKTAPNARGSPPSVREGTRRVPPGAGQGEPLSGAGRGGAGRTCSHLRRRRGWGSGSGLAGSQRWTLLETPGEVKTVPRGADFLIYSLRSEAGHWLKLPT